MEFDIDALKAFITKRTVETWEERKSPYFISFVAIDLKKEGCDYRSLIAPLRLRQWVATSDFPDVRVLVHPVHRAKVGFVPQGVDYEFPKEAAEGDEPKQMAEGALAKPSRPESGRSRRALMYFLEALSRLPEDDLEDVHIPIKVIVKLLKE